MRKFMMVIGGLALLLVAAMVIIPLVVDVDKYRPQLVQMVNDRIHGKFELGKLKLSLWGQVRVEIGGLSLQDSGGRPVLTVTDAHLHVPFSSIFGGSPSIELRMDKPTVVVIKNKSGKLNVMSLMKDAPAAPAAANANESKSVALPALATQARMTIELTHAQLAYRDEATQLVSTLKDLNVALRDVSLTRTSEIEIWADLDTSMAKVFTVKGPARITGKAKPEIAGGKLEKVSLTAKADLDGLSISVPGMFEKKKGVPCNADLAVSASSKESRIEKLEVRFFNAQLTGQGSMTQEPSQVKFQAASNAIDLKAWGELMPMVKEYDVTGTGKIDIDASGPTEKLNYQVTVRADNITAKTPMVKTRPQIDALVIVKPDVVDTIQATMKAPGTDLKVRGRMVSFDAPKLDLKVESSGMDLDQWVEFPKPAAGSSAAAAPSGGGGGESGGSGKGAAHADYDAMLDPLRKNPMMAAFSGKVDLGIKFIKAYGVRMTDVNGDLAMKDLAVKLNSFGLKVWSGSVKMAASAQLKPKAPTYQFNTGVTGLEIQQAVESQFALLKNTLLGRASFEMAGEGASFNPDQAIGNLKAKGKLRVDNATFATIDVARMASEGINGALEKIGDKIPNLKGRKVNIGGGGKSLYEYVSTTFVIDNGMFSAPDFFAKAVPQKGIELKGATQVGMKDYSLKTDWEIIDTYDLTGARQLSVEQSGVQVPHILAEGNGPLRFPVSAGCKITAPCYSYGQVPEFLAKVALNNVSQAVAGKAKAEVQKKIESVIPKSAPPAIQNGLKKLFGR